MAHCAHIPAFVLHQVTCQFATGQTLFGPLSVSLEPSLCGTVGPERRRQDSSAASAGGP